MEIVGVIGNIKIQDVGDSQVANISVATNYIYKTRNGEAQVETTWHNIVAWKGKFIADFNELEKGKHISVTGRIRVREYTASDGGQRQSFEIIANKLEVVTLNEEINIKAPIV